MNSRGPKQLPLPHTCCISICHQSSAADALVFHMVCQTYQKLGDGNWTFALPSGSRLNLPNISEGFKGHSFQGLTSPRLCLPPSNFQDANGLGASRLRLLGSLQSDLKTSICQGKHIGPLPVLETLVNNQVILTFPLMPTKTATCSRLFFNKSAPASIESALWLHLSNANASRRIPFQFQELQARLFPLPEPWTSATFSPGAVENGCYVQVHHWPHGQHMGMRQSNLH